MDCITFFKFNLLYGIVVEKLCSYFSFLLPVVFSVFIILLDEYTRHPRTPDKALFN